jgi:BrnA antitoxin of type II toxin-antitoxin system
MKKYHDFNKGKRGAVVPPPPGKTRITIRLDNEILEWFRERVESRGGGSYQTMINEALKTHIGQGGEGLEALLRRVIREELHEKSPEGSLFSLPPGRL